MFTKVDYIDGEVDPYVFFWIIMEGMYMSMYDELIDEEVVNEWLFILWFEGLEELYFGIWVCCCCCCLMLF